eukprot:scaffold6421_cov33-Phaeocystis_antarctica.AAC.1
MWAYSPEVAADYWDTQVTNPNPSPNLNPNPNPNPNPIPNQVSGYKRQAVRNISTDLAQAQPKDS